MNETCENCGIEWAECPHGRQARREYALLLLDEEIDRRVEELMLR